MNTSYFNEIIIMVIKDKRNFFLFRNLEGYLSKKSPRLVSVKYYIRYLTVGNKYKIQDVYK